MKTEIICFILHLAFPLVIHGQSSFLFRNLEGTTVNAPVFDGQGVPLAGTDYLAELWGGATADSLAPLGLLDQGNARVIKPFATQGYVIPTSSSYLVVPTVPPLGWAWVRMRAWEARLGATYEEVAALGIGGYGESSVFYAQGGDPFNQFPVPAPLTGLESFGLLPVVPEPSTWAQLALGGTLLLWVLRQKPRRRF